MKHKIGFVIIWLCVTCILFYFTYPFKSGNYIPNPFVKSRNVSLPLDAHVLDSVYSAIFNLNAEVSNLYVIVKLEVIIIIMECIVLIHVYILIASYVYIYI